MIFPNLVLLCLILTDFREEKLVLLYEVNKHKILGVSMKGKDTSKYFNKRNKDDVDDTNILKE